MEPNSPLLKCELRRMTSLQREEYGEGGNDLTMENSSKHDQSRVIKMNINSEVMWIVCALDMM